MKTVIAVEQVFLCHGRGLSRPSGLGAHTTQSVSRDPRGPSSQAPDEGDSG